MGRDRDRSERKHSKKSSFCSSRKASRRSEDERSSRHKSHKSSRHEDTKLPKGINKISEEDYFLRQTEFRVWLAQSKGKYVDDLSTEEAMDLFTDQFAKKWNRGKLSKMFYEGLPDAVVEQTKRTRHRWGFVAKLGEKEKFDLATARDSVDVATKKENLLSSGDKRDFVKRPELEKDGNSQRNFREDGDEVDKEERWKRRKVDRKREYQDTVMDELEPKATGREAQIEKRRQLSQKLHGAARDREDAQDGLDVNEDFLMGGGRGGDYELKRRLAQRDSARRRKQDEREEKLARLKAKESAQMDKFLEDMGLAGPNATGGKPMTIAPRR